MPQETFLFGLDEKPPLGKSLIYGLQWVMVTIPNVVVFSTLCGAALKLDPAGLISFSQRLLIVTGLMNILQTLKGHRYPVVEGGSSALLLSFIVLAPYGLSTIEGGMICGGLLLIAVGKFKWFKWLSPFFTPNVVGIILMLVALTLLPFCLSHADRHGQGPSLWKPRRLRDLPFNHPFCRPSFPLGRRILPDRFNAGRDRPGIDPLPFQGRNFMDRRL